MDLGLSLGYLTGPVGPAARRALELTRAAEDAGFASVWVAEAYGTDAVSVLGWLAAQTTRIGLGSAVLQVPARAAASTAMTAATLDGLSGGRFRLGLGVSGPQVAEGWYGQSFSRPLARTREYVAVVRQLLARGESRFDGRHLQLPLPDGPGIPLRLMQPTPRPDLPVHLAAVGPRNVELAGEVADGWLPSFLVPEDSTGSFDRLRAGFARRDRPVEGFEVTATVPLVVTGASGPARAEAERPVRDLLALYLGGMGSREQNFYADLGRRLGFGAAVDEVQDLYLAGRRAEAAQRVPQDLLAATTLVGSAASVRARLDDYERAGVTTVALAPVGADPVADLRAVSAPGG
ncbi:LLM class F420-dependent oxidoreductase [Kineococcus aurantiacus]|uniref:F420-dependent oxidoreductase-like protein n=1 Tax=Kineococcus aurantiacus TaxID=37633 RepID=A0A7Y9DJ14_9ACTN|nr:LLM class F420-dependent oxidoreductase [Kineococcus aurantiacus]NYD21239.1 F420-dependent oxidoreductase-like protein [Kineococcus aurantiacus]